MPGTRTPTRSRTRAGFFVSPLLTGLLPALFPGVLLAGILQGRLVDRDSGTPVSGAVATLRAPASGQVRSARSDSSGCFRLDNLSPGTWNLRLERLGYRPLELPFRMGAGPAAVEWRLEPLPLRVDETIVRARRGPGEEHAAAFVETIPLDGPRPPRADLARTLDRAAGVNVRRYGGLGSFSTLSIRGSTAEQVLVFLDGVLLNHAAGGGVDLGGLPAGGLASVEIYRGAVPERFGGNSLGGVVHLRTRPPRQQRPRPPAHRRRLLRHPPAGRLDRRPLEGLGVPRPRRLPGQPQRLPLPGRQRHRVQRPATTTGRGGSTATSAACAASPRSGAPSAPAACRSTAPST